MKLAARITGRVPGYFQLEYRAGEPDEHYQTITSDREKVGLCSHRMDEGGQ